jgi:YD repeat-containing protein
MRGKLYMKFTAIVLCFTMLMISFPSKVYADPMDEEISAENNNSSSEESKNEPIYVVGEDESKREFDVKHYVMSDQSRMAVLYNEDVHYYEDDKYKDIDNSLDYSEASETDDVNGYENKKNSFKVKFAKDAHSNQLVRIKSDKYKVTWDYLDEDVNSSEAQVGSVQTTKKEKQQFAAENVSSGVTYNDIKPGVDLQYLLEGSRMKENIIIKEIQDKYEFLFEMKVKGLEAVLNKDGSISLVDEEEKDKAVYEIPAPFMYDANNVYSKDVHYELNKTEDKYILKIIGDENFFNQPETAFPVIIDPVIDTRQEKATIDCTYAAKNEASATHNDELNLVVGNESSAYGNARTYVKINLPSLNKGDIVLDAVLNMYQRSDGSSQFFYPSVEDLQINAYAITESWNPDTLCWNNKPDYSTTALDYDHIIRSTGWRKLNITKAAKDWYDGDLVNNGIMIRANVESSDWANYGAYAYFWSDKYNSETDAYPVITINYRNNKGLEDYWTYHDMSAGRAGTAYINDYTGNLVFAHNDASTPGELMPIAINHVYNGYMAKSKYTKSEPFVGRGWKMSIQQTVRPSTEYGLSVTAAATYPYVYTDEDATEHYFYKYTDTTTNTTKLIDEDGLGLELTKGTSYTIKDDKGSVMTFNLTSGNLTNISDANGNDITITYSGNQITKVTDGAGHYLTITEDTAGYLSKIVDQSGRETVFTFSDELLTGVKYPDGTMSTYTYDSDEALTMAKAPDGYNLNFGYTTLGRGKRITSVTEKNSAASTGQKMTFDYTKYNTTIINTSGVDEVFGTSDDLRTTYMFDNYGRTKSVKQSISGKDLGASAYTYTSKESGDSTESYLRKKNRIANELSTGKTITNYAKNHNAEATGSWGASSSVDDCTFTSSFATDQSYFGSKSFKLNVTGVTGDGRARFYQDFSTDELLPGKTYTFSAYAKTSSLATVQTNKYGACLNVNAFQADGNTSFYSEYLRGTTDTAIDNGWRRLSVRFTVPDDATYTRINLAVRQAIGTVWFDGVQVEESYTPSEYNMVENSSLEEYTSSLPTGWRHYYLDAGGDDYKSTEHAKGAYSLSIKGEAKLDKELIQDIPVKGTEGDTYIVSGWAKANAVPDPGDDSRKFKISVKVTYTDGSTVWKDPAAFNHHVSDWQFASSTFNLSDETSTTKTPKTIGLYLRYYDQANRVYFDSIQLIKDEAPSYTYDDKGNLVSIVENASQKSSMQYSGVDLTKYTDAKGYDYEYAYDTKHNLDYAKSQNDIKYDYTNNSGGQAEHLVVSGVTNTMKMKTDAAYTTNGAYVGSTTNANGDTDSYIYNDAKGTLTSYKDYSGNTTSYQYNSLNDLLTTASATVNGTTISNSYGYDSSYSNLTKITHNGFDYNFTYDSFGNVDTIKVGTQNLIDNQYNGYNGSLIKSTYGNGDYTQFAYNEYGKLGSQSYNGSTKFKWYYNSSGTLKQLQDLVNNVLHTYDYDTTGRLI